MTFVSGHELMVVNDDQCRSQRKITRTVTMGMSERIGPGKCPIFFLAPAGNQTDQMVRTGPVDNLFAWLAPMTPPRWDKLVAQLLNFANNFLFFWAVVIVTCS